MRYRKEIDGLRAVAVLPVVLFHFDNNWLPGGYIGVDVFFVISGFLITSIILDEHARGEFSFLNFWKRRIKRILPALLVMVLATSIVGMFALYGPDINNLGTQGIASLLSYANISHLLLAGNYWGHEAESSPLLHTWSLSVEEQYYLLFPLILVLILSYARKWTTAILSGLCLLSLIAFLIGSKTNPTLTFYLLPTRAWELGIGAILAVKLHSGFDQRNTINVSLSVLGLLAVLASYFVLGGEGGLSQFLLIPVLGVACIIGFASSEANYVNRLLSVAPLVFIGKISYSLYLWHWPVLVYAKQLSIKTSTPGSIIIIALVMLALSIASYHLIEKPTRRNDKFIPAILGGVLIGLITSVYLKVNDFTEDTSMYAETVWHGNLFSVNPDQEWSESAKERLKGIKLFPSNPANGKVYGSGGILKLHGSQSPDIVVLGDSHALMWTKVIDEIAFDLSASVSFYAADGTPPFFDIPPKRTSESLRYFTNDEKFDFDSARLAYIDKWKPSVVVMVSRWEKQDASDVSDLIDYIGGVGSKILLIEQPPVLYFGDKNAPQYLSYLNKFPEKNVKQFVAATNSAQYQNGIELVEKLSAEHDFVFTLKTSDIYLNDSSAWVIDSDNVLYVDEDHLSYAGALKAKSRIAQWLEVMLADNE